MTDSVSDSRSNGFATQEKMREIASAKKRIIYLDNCTAADN
jgi:hypothetical protein